MIQMIKYLKSNREILQLLKENKISLIGFTVSEQEAILEAFSDNVGLSSSYGWR